MKFIILSLFISTAAFSYHNSSADNYPVKGEYSMPEKRIPASELNPQPKTAVKEEKKVEIKK